LHGGLPPATLQPLRAGWNAVADAKKIDPFDVEALEKSLNDSATRVSTIWVSFLLFGLYLVTAAGSVTHRQLFLKEPIKLPVLNIDLPFIGFWLLGPMLFVIFHAYVLIQVLLLARTAAAYNEAVDRTIANDTYQSHIRQRLANTLFAQIFAGSPRERLGLLGLVLRLMAWTTLAIAPFLILLTFELKFLPYHSQLVTWVHRLLVAADLFALFLLWPAALDSRRNIGSWSIWQYLINFAVVIVWATICILLVSFPGEPHARWITRADNPGTTYSNIQVLETGGCEESLVARFFPPNFDRLYLPRESFVDDDRLIKFDIANKQRALKPHQGERSRSLRYRNLNCGTFEGADLRRADFTSARLIGTNFRGAGLQGALLARARLHGASLDGAQLQDSSFERAKLQSADLRGAQLQGAFLDDAELQGGFLEGAELQGASLYFAQLQGAALQYAQLQGAFLNYASLQHASLFEAQLQGASLDDTKLHGVAFQYVLLQGATLRAAELHGALLNGAQLQATSFVDAELQGADLNSAVMTNAVLSNAYVWRAKNAACRDAHTEGLNSDPVFSNRAIYSLGYVRGRMSKLGPIFPTVANTVTEVTISKAPDLSVPMTLDIIATFIAGSIADIPDATQKNNAEERIRAYVVIDPASDDAALIAKVWKDCEEATKRKRQSEFDSEHATFLRNLVCDAHDNRKAIASGIIRNWISQDIDRRNFSAQLARGLLSGDGEICTATNDLDESTKALLRDAIAKVPHANRANER
jgi:uncharacterized protein YjbI with pentapeptide repeats